LENAGFTGDSPFSPKAIKRMHKYSSGLIRRINVLADKTLLAAYADDTKTVLAKHVTLAAKDSQINTPISREKLLIGATVCFSVVLIALLNFLIN
jgi:hypothetical protein